MAGAVWLRFRCELRARWASWLSLGLLVGVVAGATLAATTGARRTASAPERFRTSLRAADLAVSIQCAHASAAALRAPARCVRYVGSLPAVADVTTVATFTALVETDDGRSLQPEASDPCYSGPGQVQLLGDPAGRFGTTLNRVRLRDGRAANPSRADEVVIPTEVADRMDLHPGSRIRVSRYSGDCPPEPDAVRRPMTLRVVGVGTSPGEVPPTSGMFLSLVHVTPAFAAREAEDDTDEVAVVVRLRPGARPSALLQGLRAQALEPFVVVDFGDLGESVARGVRPRAVTLASFAVLLALAGAIVLAQMIAHQTIVEADEHGVLRALGMSRAGRVGVATVRALFVGTVAAVVAAAVAVAVSPMMPIGPARVLEPHPGVAVDGAALVVGALTTLAFVVLVSAITGWLITRRPESVPRARGARLRISGRAIAVPSAFAGVRLAVGGTGTQRSAPIVTRVVAIGVAILTVTGALTFGLGLAHLLDTPRLTGWNWDAVVGVGDSRGGPVSPAELGAALRHRPEVDSYSSGTFFSPFPGGRQLQLGRSRHGVVLYGFDDRASVGPSVVRGRAPRTEREVLLGAETLEELGLDLGDRVVARGQRGSWEEPGADTQATFRIVGTGVLPFTDRLGRGASMTLDGIARLNPDRAADGMFVRMRAGADARIVMRGVTRELGASLDDVFLLDARSRETVAEIRDLEDVDRAPLLFGLLMAGVGAGVLANVLVGATRNRRKDLAVLRVLGADGRRLRATVVVMSWTYVLLAAIVAVPLGLIAGRTAWLTFADRLHVVPVAPRPVLLVVLVLGGALVVGAIVAAPVAWRVRRRPVAPVLAGE